FPTRRSSDLTLPYGQSGTLPSAFTFEASAAPTITSVDPSSGPSGTQITITGTGFATIAHPANAVSPAIVSVGSAACVPGDTDITDSTCLEVVPPAPNCTQNCFQPIVRSPTTIVGLVP